MFLCVLAYVWCVYISWYGMYYYNISINHGSWDDRPYKMGHIVHVVHQANAKRNCKGGTERQKKPPLMSLCSWKILYALRCGIVSVQSEMEWKTPTVTVQCALSHWRCSSHHMPILCCCIVARRHSRMRCVNCFSGRISAAAVVNFFFFFGMHRVDSWQFAGFARATSTEWYWMFEQQQWKMTRL